MDSELQQFKGYIPSQIARKDEGCFFISF